MTVQNNFARTLNLPVMMYKVDIEENGYYAQGAEHWQTVQACHFMHYVFAEIEKPCVQNKSET